MVEITVMETEIQTEIQTEIETEMETEMETDMETQTPEKEMMDNKEMVEGQREIDTRMKMIDPPE